MVRPVARRSRAATGGLPEWIRPQLTELVDAAPEGSEWLHEIKFDGYRMHARLDRGAVRLLTRTGLDWTHKYPAIAAAVSSIGARQAYLDGELCGVRTDGTTSFSMIQLASDSGNAAALVFFLFDLLYLDGEDLCARPLIDRKAKLAALLSDVEAAVDVAVHRAGDGGDDRALCRCERVARVLIDRAVLEAERHAPVAMRHGKREPRAHAQQVIERDQTVDRARIAPQRCRRRGHRPRRASLPGSGDPPRCR
jgi:ATP dependent DNA ligase domain